MLFSFFNFIVFIGSLNVATLFGKRAENLKFLGIPNKTSKSIHGRNYNWGIMTVYTIRKYLVDCQCFLKQCMTRNVHFVEFERKRGLSFELPRFRNHIKRNLFRTLIFLAFFMSFYDNVFLQSESAQSKEPNRAKVSFHKRF